MQQYVVPVDGQHLGWAKSAYAANGVPIVQIVALPGGGYAIVIMAPAGGPPPDWRGMRTYRRPPFWQRIDWGTWTARLLIVAAFVGVAYVLLYGAPAALASAMPDLPTFAMPEITLPEWAQQIELPEIKLPEIELPEWAPKLELPDIGGAVEDAVDTAMAPVRKAVDTTVQIVTGLLTFAVGLVVLWLLFTFRGTIGGIAGGAAGMLRRGKK
jgi:hypothetical protein